MQERQMLKIIWQKAFNSKPLSNPGSYDRMMIILNLNFKSKLKTYCFNVLLFLNKPFYMVTDP